MLKLNYSNSLIKATVISTLASAVILMQGAIVKPVTEVETQVSLEEVATEATEATEAISKTIEVKVATTEKVDSPTVKETKPVREHKYYKVIDTNENNYETTLDYELQDYLYETCKKYGVEAHYELLMAQMYNESRFNPSIISETNDWGIMQINVCNHKWLSEALGVTDFLDPTQSIECGVYMMASHLKKYSVEAALVAYNAGGSKVRNGVTSTKYSKRVLSYVPMLTEIPEGK